jgi:hypothetical protein
MRRIPRHLLHITLDDLPVALRSALLPLLADLPQLPTAADSAVLIGPSAVTLPALAVLARHVVQGLRDYNLTLAHDRQRLRAERRKLQFYDASAFLSAPPPAEAVLCLAGGTPDVAPLVLEREAARLATFITSAQPLGALAHWRQITPERETGLDTAAAGFT